MRTLPTKRNSGEPAVLTVMPDFQGVNMINVIASITVKEGELAKFLEIFKANVPLVRAEDGCIEYSPTIDVDSGLPIQVSEPSTVTIIEKWQSLDALKAHLATPRMLAYREETKDIVEKVSLKVLQEA